MPVGGFLGVQFNGDARVVVRISAGRWGVCEEKSTSDPRSHHACSRSGLRGGE